MEKMYLVRGAEVYAPEKIGKPDILVAAGKILAVGQLEPWAKLNGVEIWDGTGMIATPGIVDQHVHILGGGGAAGFGSRGAELTFSATIKAGVTTVVGCLGIDTLGRSPSELVSKARSLKFRGLTCFCYVGGFDHPPVTVHTPAKRDIYMIDEVIGFGETAVSDFRSCHPTPLDIARLASNALVAGRLAGKAGVTHLHMGPNKPGLQPVLDAVDLGEIPIKYILPTHLNRNRILLKQAEEWARRGGFVDLSSNMLPDMYPGAVAPAEAAVELMAAGVPKELITISSDGNGLHTLYGFDDVRVFPMTFLHSDLKALVHEQKVPLETALSFITSNVAHAIAKPEKGHIREGGDADILLMDPKTLDVRGVMARGTIWVRDGELVKHQIIDV